MPLMFRVMFALLPFLWLSDGGEDAGSGDDTSDTGDGDRDDSVDTDGLGDKGKAAIKAEREARKKAEADRKALQDRLDKIEADTKKRADEEAKEQGKFRELAEQREAELTEAQTSLTTATAELEQLRTYVVADIEAIAKTVRDAAKDVPAARVLMEFHPGEDASIDQLLSWTEKAKAKLPELTANATTKPGNGPNPNPAGARNIDVKKETKRKAQQYRF